MFEDDTMISAVTDYLAIHEQAVRVIQEHLANTEYPLEERWEVFLKAKDILPIERWYSDAVTFMYDSPYDHGIDRFQTVIYADMDERILENYVEDPEDEYYDADNAARYAKRDEWREMLLNRGYAGCVYDW